MNKNKNMQVGIQTCQKNSYVCNFKQISWDENELASKATEANSCQRTSLQSTMDAIHPPSLSCVFAIWNCAVHFSGFNYLDIPSSIKF